MRFGLGSIRCEPGGMCGRVGAQCPCAADAVDADRIDGQGAVGLDVQTQHVLVVLVVQGGVGLGAVQSDAAGGPQVAGHSHHSADTAEQPDEADEHQQGGDALKPGVVDR